MEFTVWSLVTDLAIVCALLMVAQMLRAKVRILQASFLPASIIAGWAMTIREHRRTEAQFQEVRRLANTMLFDLSQDVEALPGSTARKSAKCNSTGVSSGPT